MFRSTYNNDLHAESSTRRRTSYHHQQTHAAAAAAAYDDAFRSSISAFRDLTLSHPSEETSALNRSSLAAYLPYTPGEGDASISRTRSDISMGQICPPNVMSPNNIFPRLGGYTNQYQFPMRGAPLDMLGDILRNPYTYMTCSKTMCHLLGNLLDVSDTMFRDCFLRAILKSKDSLVDAICTFEGSCVLQKLIKLVKHQPLIAELPRILEDQTLRLMTNNSGMRVVRTCFIELDDDEYRPLFRNFMENDNWLEMAKDKNGCVGLNDCLHYMSDDLKNCLLRRITIFAPHLALDTYGTFVVQHVIDLQTIHTEEIVTSLKPFYKVLCTIKNGSHVVEKCIKTRYTCIVVTELIKSGRILKFACHEFGNYVIQNAIIYTKVNDNNGVHEQLMTELNIGRGDLQNSKYGKNVARLLTYYSVLN